eukprot:7353532-Prymnesium_polylepis.1
MLLCHLNCGLARAQAQIESNRAPPPAPCPHRKWARREAATEASMGRDTPVESPCTSLARGAPSATWTRTRFAPACKVAAQCDGTCRPRRPHGADPMADGR